MDTTQKKLTQSDYSFKYAKDLPQLFNTHNKYILEIHAYISLYIKIKNRELWKNSKNEKLDLEDLIIHLCVHISYSDLFKKDLRHYLDIYIILQRHEKEINWKLLKDRVLLHHSENGVYLVFKVIEKLFDVPLKKEIQNLVINPKEYELAINRAIEFLWLYDKTSKDYKFFTARNRVMLEKGMFIKKAFNSIFVSKDELAFLYSKDKNDTFFNIYYIVRLIDLIKKHVVKLFKVHTNDSKQEFTNKTIYIYTVLNNDLNNKNQEKILD